MAEEEKRKRKPRVKMKEQEPQERIKNFNEVPFGYTPDQAIEEASRCQECKRPSCVPGCPVEIDIPGFISLIKEGKFLEAVYKLKEKNSLPAICGRVCPQEDQCEILCTLAKKGEPVAIGTLERFVADYEAEQGKIRIPEIPKSTGRKVAVIGSGPGGLTCASDLTLSGHQVTLFEALHKPGGVLVYGIPEFRLPKAIVYREVDYIQKLGVELATGTVVGKIFTVDELFERGYEAIFISTGAGLPVFFGIPGENHNGVYSANEYLTRSNLMKAYLFPEYDTPIKKGKRVAVFGGGNVAMDSARTALRLGAEEVYLIYRRSEVEMPARAAEVEHAKEEGIIFKILTNPTKFIGDEKGNLTGLECLQNELGEPDESGRRRPVPIKGSEFTIDIDTAVVAIGTGPNPLLLKTMPDLELNRRGYIVAEEETGKTSKRGVFAGGDIVTGAATVILAMGAGRKAANAINEYFKWIYW